MTQIKYTTTADVITAAERVKSFEIKKGLLAKTEHGADLLDVDQRLLSEHDCYIRTAMSSRNNLLSALEKIECLIPLGLNIDSKTYDLALVIPEIREMTEQHQLDSIVDYITSCAND